MVELTEYEVGVLYGTLTVEQWKNLPEDLQDKLRMSPKGKVQPKEESDSERIVK